MRRLPVILALIHIVLATTLIVREETLYWSDVKFRQKAEDLARLETKRPTPSDVGWDCRSFDLWPSLPVKAVYFNNLPLSSSFGYYQHPLSACDSPRLVGLVNEHTPIRLLRVKTKIWLYNAVFVLLIGVQWWVIGRWALIPSRRFVKIVAIAITGAAALMTAAVILSENRSPISMQLWLWVVLPRTLSLLLLWAGLLISLVAEPICLIQARYRSANPLETAH